MRSINSSLNIISTVYQQNTDSLDCLEDSPLLNSLSISALSLSPYRHFNSISSFTMTNSYLTRPKGLLKKFSNGEWKLSLASVTNNTNSTFCKSGILGLNIVKQMTSKICENSELQFQKISSLSCNEICTIEKR